MLPFAQSGHWVNIPLSRPQCPFQPPTGSGYMPEDKGIAADPTTISAPRGSGEPRVPHLRLPHRNTQAQQFPIGRRWNITQRSPTERRTADNRVSANSRIARVVPRTRDGLCPRIAQRVSLKFLIEPIHLVLTSQLAALAPIRQERGLALADSASISPQSRKTPANNKLTSVTAAAPTVRGQPHR